MDEQANFFEPIEELKTSAEMLMAAEITLTDELEKPPVCLYMNNQSLFYLGDISTTIGKAKGRKTFACGLILAAIAGNCTIQNKFRATMPENKRTVLYFDTEQGAYHAQKAAMRVLRLLGVESLPNFKAYGLRNFTPPERLQIIEYAILNTPNLGFVLIDGIRDVITSINDEEQATMITNKLLKLSGEQNIHINCVLHMNKGDNNARGHVGTELINKSLAVLGVNKKENMKEYSTIEAIACRDMDPDPITFGINTDGLPYVLEPEQMQILNAMTESKNKKSIRPADFKDEIHIENIASKIFNTSDARKYSEIISCIKLIYDVGYNKAGDFLTYFINKGLVLKLPNGAKSLYSRPL